MKPHLIRKYGLACGPEELLYVRWPSNDRIYPGYVFHVHDTPPERDNVGSKHFWYPINEISNWGYGPFFWFIKLVTTRLPWGVDADNAGGEWHRCTYVCCAGGACRSPFMVIAYLLYRDHTDDEIKEMFGEDARSIEDKSTFMDQFRRSQARGVIPGDLEEFFRTMKEHRTHSMASLLKDLGHPWTH